MSETLEQKACINTAEYELGRQNGMRTGCMFGIILSVFLSGTVAVLYNNRTTPYQNAPIIRGTEDIDCDGIDDISIRYQNVRHVFYLNENAVKKSEIKTDDQSK